MRVGNGGASSMPHAMPKSRRGLNSLNAPSRDRSGGRFPDSIGRERETPAGGGIPRGKENMTDERIDPVGSVTPEPTCTECRRRPRWAGSLWCEPCYVRLGIMDGTAAFSDAMARLGESAS